VAVRTFASMDHGLTLSRPALNYWAVKRLTDILLASLLLAIFWPALVVIALAIACDSHGPVFYVQRRVGYRGLEFSMLKFRTMMRDRRIRRAPIPFPDRRRTLKVRDDPRITRVGRALRRTSLDELPQLINVLRGEMSLVGPRPELPEVVAQYAALHHLRHTMPPGLTGWWQIRGRCLRPDRCTLGDDLAIKLTDDLYYLEHRSLTFDLKILLLTVPVVLRGSGAG
jgi:lipopolysaccharide/colanic/teichoic acid biosynthesis glycosyltransferase